MKLWFACWVFIGGILFSHGADLPFNPFNSRSSPPIDIHEDLPMEEFYEGYLPIEEEFKTESVSRCGHSWKEDPNSGACYLIPDVLLDWPNARKHCQSLGSELCSVLSLSENYFISSILAFRNPNPEWGTWIGYFYANVAWKWSDGTPGFYTNFLPGQPNGNGCAYIGNPKTFGWLNAGCTAAPSKGYPCCKKVVG